MTASSPANRCCVKNTPYSPLHCYLGGHVTSLRVGCHRGVIQPHIPHDNVINIACSDIKINTICYCNYESNGTRTRIYFNDTEAFCLLNYTHCTLLSLLIIAARLQQNANLAKQSL